MTIHKTAFIEDGAEIGRNAEIGPFCHVDKAATIGDGVKLISHVIISGRTAIGEGTIVHPFAVLGGPPQHLGYRGEDTALEIDAGNIIREHVTMNIGTAAGGGVTRVGKNGIFMAGAHVAHDCQVGDYAIFANNASLGGHVEVGDHVFLGALSGIHQFCRIGDFSFTGGCAAVTADIIPFGSVMGNHARLVGLNVIGMKRRGLTRETIHSLRSAYRTLFLGEDTFKERVARASSEFGDCPEVMQIVSFINQDAPRPLMGPVR